MCYPPGQSPRNELQPAYVNAEMENLINLIASVPHIQIGEQTWFRKQCFTFLEVLNRKVSLMEKFFIIIVCLSTMATIARTFLFNSQFTDYNFGLCTFFLLSIYPAQQLIIRVLRMVVLTPPDQELTLSQALTMLLFLVWNVFPNMAIWKVVAGWSFLSLQASFGWTNFAAAIAYQLLFTTAIIIIASLTEVTFAVFVTYLEWWLVAVISVIITVQIYLFFAADRKHFDQQQRRQDEIVYT